jgi:hypothetical protein
MLARQKTSIWQRSLLLLGLCWAGTVSVPAWADEKQGMPDLAQIDQTCLPTSTTNLIIWFGKHGYPKLIQKDDSVDDGYIHTVHRVMADTDARFDWGTRMETITVGIDKYIKEAGYAGDVEYRGLAGKKLFSQEWLKENNDPNKGFILLLAYIHVQYHPGNAVFSRVVNVGHAVTLVNAESDMILIHDPAHENDETGRKIITPQMIPQGTLQEVGTSEPVSGLLLLSGSLLGAPPDSEVMLTGAVCVTMHPAGDSVAPPSASPSSAPNVAGGNVSGSPTSSPSSPATPGSVDTNWWTWLFSLVFTK